MNTTAQQLLPARSHRWIWLAVLVAVACLLGYGYYLQYVHYLDPCPLCMTQRFFYYLLGIAGLIGFFTYRHNVMQRVMGVLAVAAAIGGLVTAGRQVWLQHLPADQVPECGPGLEFWLENMPFMQTLQLLFKGDGNCAEVHWRFLGLSIAEWSLAWFILFFIIGCKQLLSRRQVQAH